MPTNPFLTISEEIVSSSASLKLANDRAATMVSEKEHLSTDHLLDNISGRAVSGGFVTVGAQAAKFLLNFITAAVLARLLSPKEFGLVGMVLGVTSLVGIFKELGLSIATVQREKITQQQVSNLFWINVAVSGLLAVVGTGLAPAVAWFYRDPRVTWIMVALSMTFLLTGSTVQHQALLTRQMRFSALAVIDVTSIVIGFTTACLLARFGFAYWALVAQQLATAASSLVLTWCTSGWRPSMPARGSGVRPLVSFGAHLTIADLIGRFSVTSDTILIGRLFGAAPLGLYTRASVLLARPMEQIFTPIGAVLIPVLSRLNSNSERYRHTFLRTFDALAIVILPFSAMCFALAKPIVLVILGTKWTGVIPLFSAFALVAVSTPLSTVCTWMFESQGRGRDQLRNHTLAGAVTVAAYLVGLKWGPLGLVVSLAITSMVIRLPIVYYIAGRRGPVSTRDLWIAFLSHVPCWLTVYAAARVARMMVEQKGPIIQLLVCVPIGLAVGYAGMLLFRRPRQSASQAWSTLQSSLGQRLGWANAHS